MLSRTARALAPLELNCRGSLSLYRRRPSCDLNRGFYPNLFRKTALRRPRAMPGRLRSEGLTHAGLGLDSGHSIATVCDIRASAAGMVTSVPGVRCGSAVGAAGRTVGASDLFIYNQSTTDARRKLTTDMRITAKGESCPPVPGMSSRLSSVTVWLGAMIRAGASPRGWTVSGALR